MLWALVPVTLIVAIVSRHDYNLLGLYLRWHRYCSSTAVSMFVALFVRSPTDDMRSSGASKTPMLLCAASRAPMPGRLTRIHGCQRDQSRAHAPCCHSSADGQPPVELGWLPTASYRSCQPTNDQSRAHAHAICCFSAASCRAGFDHGCGPLSISAATLELGTPGPSANMALTANGWWSRCRACVCNR
jgi:hypothetical protein